MCVIMFNEQGGSQQETGCVAFQVPFDVAQWNEG